MLGVVMPKNYIEILKSILIETDQINALVRLILSEPDQPGRHQLANDLREQVAMIEGRIEAELNTIIPANASPSS
jgi:hypothetical protein